MSKQMLELLRSIIDEVDVDPEGKCSWSQVANILPRMRNALQSSAESAQPLRRCGMCMTWNSKPCGEQCGWSPDDPTPEQAKAKDLKEKRRHNRKHPLPVTFE